jgi:NAD(P)-dependent dehydrogenase (short-subunit alcohol dehydrogenase family)
MVLPLASRNAGTRALITGGAQGLGLAVARQLVAEGATHLALVGRSTAKGAAAVAELEAAGARVVFIAADIGSVADCQRAISEAVSALGNINALVNAAASTARDTLLDATPDGFDRMFAVNVRGPFFLMQGFVRHLVERDEPGSIVNVMSMAAHAGQSFIVSYSASKGALVTLTRNVANAWRRHRIRCNGVLPGWMDTPGEDEIQKTVHGASDDWLARAEAGQPMGKLAKPDELAPLITYLLSPQSGVMTGSIIDYDQNVAGAYPE